MTGQDHQRIDVLEQGTARPILASGQAIVIAVVAIVLAAASLLSWRSANSAKSPTPTPAAASPATPISSAHPRASTVPREPLATGGRWSYNRDGRNFQIAIELVNYGPSPLRIHAARLAPVSGTQIKTAGLVGQESLTGSFSSDRLLPLLPEVVLGSGEATGLYAALDLTCPSPSAQPSAATMTFEIDYTLAETPHSLRLEALPADEWQTVVRNACAPPGHPNANDGPTPPPPTPPTSPSAPTASTASTASTSDPLVNAGGFGWLGEPDGVRFYIDMLNAAPATIHIEKLRLAPSPGVTVTLMGIGSGDQGNPFTAPPLLGDGVELRSGESTNLVLAVKLDCDIVAAAPGVGPPFDITFTSADRRLTQHFQPQQIPGGWLDWARKSACSSST